jgi:GMP synthase (glutamine-hydrolysing)
MRGFSPPPTAIHHEDWKLYLLRAASRRKHRNMGSLEAVLQEAGVPCDYHESATGQKLRGELDRYSHVIILGGNIGAYEDARHDFLHDEMQIIEQAIARGLSVLGICLGAQLLARIHGARVYPGSHGPELGWHSVALTEAGRDEPLLEAFPVEGPVFQWHHDTFDLPTGASHLVRSSVYESQSFQIGRRVWAFQFHLEADSTLIHSWLRSYARGRGAYAEAERQATEQNIDAFKCASQAFFRGFLSLGAAALTPAGQPHAGSPGSTGDLGSGG